MIASAIRRVPPLGRAEPRGAAAAPTAYGGPSYVGGPNASFWARSNGCVTVKAAEFQCQHDSYH